MKRCQKSNDLLKKFEKEDFSVENEEDFFVLTDKQIKILNWNKYVHSSYPENVSQEIEHSAALEEKVIIHKLHKEEDKNQEKLPQIVKSEPNQSNKPLKQLEDKVQEDYSMEYMLLLIMFLCIEDSLFPFHSIV